MKLKSPMLVVTDMDKSVAFYQKVLGLHIIMDFGANKTLTGGLALCSFRQYINAYALAASLTARFAFFLEALFLCRRPLAQA